MNYDHLAFQHQFDKIEQCNLSYLAKIERFRILKCDMDLHYQDEPFNRPQPLYDNLVMLTC